MASVPGCNISGAAWEGVDCETTHFHQHLPRQLAASLLERKMRTGQALHAVGRNGSFAGRPHHLLREGACLVFLTVLAALITSLSSSSTILHSPRPSLSTTCMCIRAWAYYMSQSGKYFTSVPQYFHSPAARENIDAHSWTYSCYRRPQLKHSAGLIMAFLHSLSPLASWKFWTWISGGMSRKSCTILPEKVHVVAKQEWLHAWVACSVWRDVQLGHSTGCQWSEDIKCVMMSILSRVVSIE
jgi:hypothetical protein